MKDPRRFLAYDFALLLLFSLYLFHRFGPEPRVLLPTVRGSWSWNDHHDPYDRLILSIDPRGATYLADEPVTDLAGALRVRVREHSVALQARGRPGSVEIADGLRASGLGVDVRADTALPWGEVHHLLCVVGEQGLFRVELRARIDSGVLKSTMTRLPVYLPAPDSRPTSRLRIDVSSDRQALPDVVAEFVRERQRYEQNVVVDLCAGADTPYGDVVAVLEALLEAGASRIDLLAREAEGTTRRAVVIPR